MTPQHRETPRLAPVAVLRWLPMAYLCLLVLVTFTLRTFSLDTLPQSLSLDESVDGLDALQLVRNHWLTPFLQNNFGRETLFLYVQGIGLQVYGISAFALRFASVLVGTLTIPLMYAVGRQLAVEETPPRLWARTSVGLLAATGLAVCYWHIYFSRQALRAILLPLLLLAMLWCYQRWRQGRPTRVAHEWPWLLLAGVLLGATQYTYLAARLVPIVFAVFAIVGLLRASPSRRGMAIASLLVPLSVAALVSVPLILYFIRNPQAFVSRAGAIVVPFGGAMLAELADNMGRLLLVQFGGGAWLGHWPSLNILMGVGMLVGLVVCVRHMRRPDGLPLLAWWAVGFTPVLFSQQDWNAVTTILRGVVAWPAVCLISAVGITALVGLYGRRTTRGRGTAQVLVPALALLLLGGATSAREYFLVWAAGIDQPRSDVRTIADYLNDQTQQVTLTPNRFYADFATNFLLRARYPNLLSAGFQEAQTLIGSGRRAAGGIAAACLLPVDESTPTAWVLLDPSGERGGTAYLLPHLTHAQAVGLADEERAKAALRTLPDEAGNAVAAVYPLDAGASFLSDDGAAMQPLDASFAADVLLQGYRVEPAVVRRGQEVTLFLSWQAERLIDGDYDLFIHLFNVQTGRRVGQINQSLGSSVLLHSHYWPAGLSVVDAHHFTLPLDAPEGAYRFEVGLYHRASQVRLPATAGDGRPIADDRVLLGKLLVQDQAPRSPQRALDITFQDNIGLDGLDMPDSEAGSLSLVVHWRARGVISRDYTVFVHVLDAAGTLVAQQDNMPQSGHYPTSLWSPGEAIIDPYVLNLPGGALDGRYALRIGLYDVQTGQRLQLQDGSRDYAELTLRMANGRFSLPEGEN